MALAATEVPRKTREGVPEVDAPGELASRHEELDELEGAELEEHADDGERQELAERAQAEARSSRQGTRPVGPGIRT